MACSSPKSTEDGFATPAAAAISLALSVVAIAVTGASVTALRLARGDLVRDQAEFALAGDQDRAALATVAAHGPGRMRWTIPSDDGAVEVLAEPEAAKLSLAAAADLDEGTLQRLGARDAAGVAGGLARMAREPAGRSTLADLDASATWRACAPSAISPFGLASRLGAAKATAPTPGASSWRIGEVWRIRVTGAGGWVDDRLVRFTGAPAHPAAVIQRTFSKSGDVGDRCDALIGAS